METCRTCRYRETSASPSKVFCHRYPPVYVPNQDVFRFPLLGNYQFCGEWKPLKKNQVEVVAGEEGLVPLDDRGEKR